LMLSDLSLLPTFIFATQAGEARRKNGMSFFTACYARRHNELFLVWQVASQRSI